MPGTSEKSRLPSRYVSVGAQSAPHRSYYYAMGMTEAEIAQPFVGVATTWNEAAPCNIALARQAQAAKKGVAAAHGTPREFTTITVTDGIAMGHGGMLYSLPSRDLIADSVEYMVNAHCADAMVCISNCDKITPGMLMAAMRLNIPVVFVSGGPMEAGKVNWQGKVRGLDLVDAMVAAIKSSLKKGDMVTLVGFGSFYVSERAARSGRNPRTGETLQIRASRVPKFRAGKALKDAIN